MCCCVVAVGVIVRVGTIAVSRMFHAYSPRAPDRSGHLGPMGGGVNPSMRTLTP